MQKSIEAQSPDIIHDFGVNSHLIKVSTGRVASMGMPSFECENTSFGWQKTPRVQDISLAVLK